MSAQKIHFFTEEITFSLKNKTGLRRWLKEVIAAEGRKLGEICYIFCSDPYLLEINHSYLAHDTLTDIITFDHAIPAGQISGDIYISVDRLKDNATQFNVSETDELLRLLVHGILHLCGYKDKINSDKVLMRNKEDMYIRLYKTRAV